MSTGSRLKNRKCYSINCQLSQPSMLASNKGALVPGKRRDDAGKYLGQT